MFEAMNFELVEKAAKEIKDGKDKKDVAKVKILGQDRSMRGIYKFEGKFLVYCWGAPGKPRPKKFETPKGSNQTMIRLERFSTGEQALEKTLRDLHVDIHKDEIGWITTLVIRHVEDADAVIRLARPLKKLKTLYVEEGELSDQGLEQVAHFPELNSLQVISDSITDAGLAKILQLKKMSSLMIEGKNITNKSVERLGEFASLYNVHFRRTKINEGGVVHLSSIKRLSSLTLDGSPIGDQGVETLVAGSPQVSFLKLAETKISDEGVAHLSKLTRLNNLSLQGNAITDQSLDQLPKSIRYLDLSHTNISDQGLRKLAHLSQLTELKLGSAAITDDGLTAIANQFSQLQSIDIRDVDMISEYGLEELLKIKKLRNIRVTKGKFDDELIKEFRRKTPRVNIR